MNVGREQISVALFNLLDGYEPLANLCETITRTLKIWDKVDPSQRPYLLLFKGGPGTEEWSQPQGQRIGLTKYRINYNLWLYVSADPTGQMNAETVINNIADQIDAAFAVNQTTGQVNKGERQTLGGLVNNCWIDGGNEWAREFLDDNIVTYWRIAVETGI